MDRDRFARLELLFAEARALPRGARDQFVAEQCAGDAELAAQLRRLLAGPGVPRSTPTVPADAAVGGAAGDGVGEGPLPVSAWSLAAEDLSDDHALHGCATVEFEGRARPCLGGIALLARLGEGGMGLVYFGVHPRLAREVAVKVLAPPRLEQSNVVRDRFIREAQLAASIRSPHLVEVFDVDRDARSGCHYIVMEFVRGGSAQDWAAAVMAEGMPSVPEDRALDVCIAATQGLVAAHQQGIIHRDIKPANILVPFDPDGRARCAAAKLADLGLAKKATGGGDLTSPHLAFGTPGFMASEQIEDARSAGKRADVFSMGATLYALLYGLPPFVGRGLGALLSTMRGQYEPVRAARPDVTRATAALIDTCLQKSAADRYPDATALLEALQAVRSSFGGVAAPGLSAVVVSYRDRAESGAAAQEAAREPSAGLREFRHAVEDARQQRDLGLLGLLGEEMAHEVPCLRWVGRAQFQLEAWRAARRTWECVGAARPNELEPDLRLGTICQRLGDLESSSVALRRALQRGNLAPADRAEAYALLGRNQKRSWVDSWIDVGEDSPRRALQSPLLLDGFDHYRTAFLEDQNHFYSGLNALALCCLALGLADASPATWRGAFESSAAAEARLAQLRESREHLRGAVRISLDAARHRRGEAGVDPWLELSEADYHFLVSDRPEFVRPCYERAFARIAASGFEAEIGSLPLNAVRQQLDMFRTLGVLAANARAALAVVDAQRCDPEDERPANRRAVVFTGHRLDEPTRDAPRFPAAAEKIARKAITQALEELVRKARGEWVGIAGGACGGDILFHEACEKLGLRSQLMLPTPVEDYEASSVAPGGPSWSKRFRGLVERLRPRVLGPASRSPRWVDGDPGDAIWERANLWMLHTGLSGSFAETTLMALWDGQPGDDTGGTSHMVAQAEERGAAVVVLDAAQLFRRHL